jgi:hypothetical protein
VTCDILVTPRPSGCNGGKRRSALPQFRGVLFGAPSGFRTPDPLIKSQLLYQLS